MSAGRIGGIAAQLVVLTLCTLTTACTVTTNGTVEAAPNDRRVDLHDAGDPNAHYWSLSKATDNDGILTIIRVEEESTRGWSCQRALTAENNVVVDVSACMHHVDDQGIQIARQITQKVEHR